METRNKQREWWGGGRVFIYPPAMTDSEVSQWQEQPIGNCRHGNLYASVREWIDKP